VIAAAIIAGLLLVIVILADRAKIYAPRNWHFAGPLCIILIGFAIHQNYSGAWEVIVFINAPLAPIAWYWAAYIYKAGVAYQMYVTRGNAPETKTEQPKQDMGVGFVPLVRPLMEQTVEPIEFDMERQFAKTLIIMRDYKPNDEAVDLREETWKRPNKFGSRDAYLAVREKWQTRGIVGKKTARKNSVYVVKDWRAVELIANGNPLP
jgi:hypothetical protein